MYLGGLDETASFKTERLAFVADQLKAMGDPHHLGALRAERPVTLGWHLMADIENVKFGLLNDVKALEDIVKRAVVAGKLTLVRIWSHKFKPQGLSVVALIQESHIAIHTWPEFGLATVDIYTCSGKLGVQKAFESVADALDGDIYNFFVEERGVRYDQGEKRRKTSAREAV